MLESAPEEQKLKLLLLRDEIFERFISRIESKVIEVKDINDGIEISNHYAVSHLAVALILVGQERKDEELCTLGATYLRLALDNQEKFGEKQDYHHDFNNFAFCVAIELLPEGNFRSEIQNALLRSSDSQHATVNWLPMRWYVNKWRYVQTGRTLFLDRMTKCAELVSEANNEDGGFEDRLPKGTSFNLQYSIATTSLLQFINLRDCDYQGVTGLVENGLGFLLSKELPDGDINYQGRGANQIFGWSAWLYLLSSSGQVEAINRALDFLNSKIHVAQQKNNLMLNNFNGRDRIAWWDYHHESVYYSHCLMWLSLAIMDWGKRPVTPKSPCAEDSGLILERTADYAIAKFNGRSLYASERGPSLVGLWLKDVGWVCKSSGGPWFGRFGQDSLANDVLVFNHLGFLSINETKSSWLKRTLQRFMPSLLAEVSVVITQDFVDFEANAITDGLRLSFMGDSSSRALNVPLNSSVKDKVQLQLEVDGKNVPLAIVNCINNQYGLCEVFRSPKLRGDRWQLTIKRKGF